MKEYDFKSDYYAGFARVKLNEKYGIIDKKGEEICDIKYDVFSNFNYGFARVRLNDKYGHINNKGIEVIPCEYNYEEVYIQLEKYKLKQLRLSKLERLL